MSNGKFEIVNYFSQPQLYQPHVTTQKNVKYVTPNTIPKIYVITFTNQRQQINIYQDLKTSYLISLGFYCKGTTACKNIRVALAEANAEVKVAASINDLMKVGLYGGNPGGVFPFVTKYDDLNLEYAAIAAPSADVPLNGIILYLDVPPASEAGVSAGTTAYVELAYLIKVVEG